MFVHSIKVNLSTKELKAIAKIRGIKGYKSTSEDELLSSLTSSKLVKTGKKRSEKNLMNQDINFLN